MRSILVTACVVLLGAGAPAPGVRQHSQQAPAQAQAVPPQRQDQTERDRQGTPRPNIHRGNKAVALQPGSGQLPEAVGLLLSLALLSGAAPPPAISQKEID
jgi:hypothetical protein